MFWAFEVFEYILHLLKRRQSQVPWFNFEGFVCWLLGRQAETQEVIDHLLERTSRAPELFLKQFGDVVIQSERSSHILML